MRYRNALRHLAVILLTGAVSACDSTAPEVGEYALASVNGSPLPYTPEVGTRIVVGGTLVLRRDGAYAETITRCRVGEPTSDNTDVGSWNVFGDEIILTSTSGRVRNATRNGGAVTLDSGDTYVYQRR